MTPTDPEADPLDFTSRTVVVTGGTKGIGRAIAEAFLQRQADVIVVARRPPDDDVSGGDRRALFVPCDVREPDQVSAAVEKTMAATGRLDVLVNNAGGAPSADSVGASPRFAEKVIAVNLLGPLTFCQAVHPIMAAQDAGGVIINIASVSGMRANPNGVAYGAAKAGLLNMTQTLAVEWGPAIRVVALTAGMTLTEDTRSFFGGEAGIAAIEKTVPLGRIGRPQDVASGCLFLASPLAAHVSGANLVVDGGGERPAYLAARASAETDDGQP